MHTKWIPITKFENRIFESKERVHFTAIDPYGHMNSARYFEMVINHRAYAVEEAIGCYTKDILEKTGCAFVLANANMSFARPSFQGETLVVQSWLTSLKEKTFHISFTIFGRDAEDLRYSGELRFCGVDLGTHRPCKLPEALPTRDNPELIMTLPLRDLTSQS